MAQHEPAARGGPQRAVVIDDDPVVAPNAKLAHRFSEFAGRGKHLRRGVQSIGHLGNIEEPRAGDVSIGEFRYRIAVVGRQEGAAIDDGEIGRIKIVR